MLIVLYIKIHLWISIKKELIGGVVEDWTPVLKQLNLASTCLDKVDQFHLKLAQASKAKIKLRFYNFSIYSNQLQIDNLSMGWVSNVLHIDRIYVVETSKVSTPKFNNEGSLLSMQREPQQENNLYYLRLKKLNLLRVIQAHMQLNLTAPIDTMSTPSVKVLNYI